jgi:hypothetical protein
MAKEQSKIVLFAKVGIIIFIFYQLGTCVVDMREQEANRVTKQVEQPKDWRKVKDRVGAYVEAAYYMERQLKAPSTAKWPSNIIATDHVFYIGDQTYEVKSWVEASNSFGVPVRTNYHAKVQQVLEGEFRVLEFIVLN